MWSITIFFKTPSFFPRLTRGIVLTLVWGGILAGCGSPANDSPGNSSRGTILFPHTNQSTHEQLPKVKLIRTTKTSWTPELVATGRISPFRTAIKSALPGRILKIFIQEGDEVMAGQKVAELDPGPILREIGITESLRNRLNQEIQLTAEKISLTNKTSRDSLSAPPYPLTENLQELKKQLSETGKKLEDLKKNQEKASLRSPINGKIEVLFVSPGEEVTPGKRLAIIKDLKRLEINLFLPQKNESFILKAKEAEVKIDRFPGEVFFGEIVHTSIHTLPDERIAVKIKLSYPMGKIRQGMRGKVVITGQELENVCLFPVRAIMEDTHGKFVYQFMDGEITRKSVKLGHRSKEVAVIASGLKEGALVVANPTDDLKPETKVIADIVQ